MTAPRPVLGIICCNRAVGTETAQTVINRYATAAMRHADCAALLVPALPGLMHADEVADRLDGILLTGTPSNIEPARYGDDGSGEGPFDPDRDAMMLALVDAMAARGRPLFGICRGFQELNVALGGTLRRDAGDGANLSHHAPDDVGFDGFFDHRHPVALTPGGLLARTYGRGELTVNSVHYQGVARLADGLSVEATAPDGLVEAFSGRVGDAPLLAVQWHPEWHSDDHADSRTFFHLLGRMLRGDGLF